MDLARLSPWITRATWTLLPFLAGPAMAAALDPRSVPVRTTASVGLWAVWGIVLCASLVLHPVSLTALRVAAPGAVVAAGWAAAEGPAGAGFAALAATALAGAAAFLPETAIAYVNGPAYPNERRYPLRVPGALLLGPLYLAWAATIGAPVAAALLLACRRWVPGGVVAGATVVTTWYLGRALHGLSRRWVVFVPAGLVLHDPMTLVDPVLFPKMRIAGIAAAKGNCDGLDLTQGAPGPAVELSLRGPASLVLTKPGARVGPTVDSDVILFTPTRPGLVLSEAGDRMGGGPPALTVTDED